VSTPPPLPPPEEDASVIRERQQWAEPSDAAAEPSLELDDAFFEGGASLYLETSEDEDEEDEGGVENPELSPAQYQRRRQLRRQVAMLMVALALFTLVTLFVRVAQ
jgi:hypothetical protein